MKAYVVVYNPKDGKVTYVNDENTKDQYEAGYLKKDMKKKRYIFYPTGMQDVADKSYRQIAFEKGSGLSYVKDWLATYGSCDEDIEFDRWAGRDTGF